MWERSQKGQTVLDGLEIESGNNMDLDTVSDKHLHELERLTKDLLEIMKKAKLLDNPITELLRALETSTEKARRTRFDEVNPEFRGY